MRRIATTLKSMFGISRPTTCLPGIGASIRIVRAASAIARSSASASIRLTLIDGSGSTSYWVTTGPAFQRVTWLGMLKLASLLIDDRRVVGVVHAHGSTSAARRPRGGSSAAGGTRGASGAGSDRHAAPRPGRPRRPRRARPSAAAASGKSVIRSPVIGVGGGPAKTDETGRAARAATGSSCRADVAGAAPAAQRGRGPDTGVASARARRAWSIAAAPAEAAGAASALPRFRAPRPNGASSSRTGRSSAITSPASRIPRKTMNAPRGLTRRLTKVASTLPIRPPERPSSMPPSARSAIRASVAA